MKRNQLIVVGLIAIELMSFISIHMANEDTYISLCRLESQLDEANQKVKEANESLINLQLIMDENRQNYNENFALKQDEYDLLMADYVLYQLKQEAKGEYVSKDVPLYSSCKTIEYSSAITTNENKPQGLLLKRSIANEDGFLTYDGRYLIALGSYYTKTIGTYVDLVFEDGRILQCVLGDAKSDAHTNATNQYAVVNRDVVEFIVDKDIYDTTIKNVNNFPDGRYSGNIVEIRIY